MSKTMLWKVCAAFMMLSLVLAACGGGTATATQPVVSNPPTAAAASGSTANAPTANAPTANPNPPTETVPAAVSDNSKFTASSGFVCPNPNPKMVVTSKELNLFVWTEYIPKDMSECFEKVYGITVNRDEYLPTILSP